MDNFGFFQLDANSKLSDAKSKFYILVLQSLKALIFLQNLNVGQKKFGQQFFVKNRNFGKTSNF